MDARFVISDDGQTLHLVLSFQSDLEHIAGRQFLAQCEQRGVAVVGHSYASQATGLRLTDVMLSVPSRKIDG